MIYLLGNKAKLKDLMKLLSFIFLFSYLCFNLSGDLVLCKESVKSRFPRSMFFGTSSRSRISFEILLFALIIIPYMPTRFISFSYQIADLVSPLENIKELLDDVEEQVSGFTVPYVNMFMYRWTFFIMFMYW